MALDDIKKAILAEAQKIADQRIEEVQKKIETIEAGWDKKTKERKEKAVESADRKIKQKIEQIKFEIQTESQAEILGQKKEIIDQVYSSVLGKLSSLSDDQYIELMEKLIQDLPNTSGCLLTIESKRSLLKKALANSDKKHQLGKEAINGQGGFIFQTDEIEIDFSFEAILRSIKEKTLLNTASIIFSEEN